MPFPVVYLFSDCMFVVLYYLMKYRRAVVHSNLKNSFPNKTLEERKRIEKEFYKHFCDLVFESIKTLTITKKAIAKRFHIKNEKLLVELFAQKKGILLYSAHYGNWEWLCFISLFTSYRTQALYQKLSNAYFNDLMLRIRTRFGMTCFESDQGYKGIIKAQQEKVFTITGIIGDQSPKKNSSKHWVHFLNQETAFLTGVDRIVKKFNYTVIFPLFYKYKRGKYAIEFSVISDHPKELANAEIINAYARKLEESIVKSPELWLWSHRRWKLTNTDNKQTPYE